MRDRMYRFMMGRYGMDDLGKFNMFLLLVVLIVSIFFNNIIISLLLWFLLIYSYFRMLSRNTAKRYAENQAYLRIRDKVLFFKKTKQPKDPYHKIFLCPSCKQKIRVPKGKGKICITCPKCKRDFLKRT